MTALALFTEVGQAAPSRVEARRLRAHAAQCMEEAALITWAVAGLAVCVRIAAWDVGLGHWVPFDAARLLVWTVLAAGVLRHRALPAYLLLFDVSVRATWLTASGEAPFLPAFALVAAVCARALIARLRIEGLPTDDGS